MKKDTHPDVKEVTISCACGATYQTTSVRDTYTVEICSNCHPFFSGKHKLIDAAGRVDRFNKKYSRTSNI